MTIEIKNAKVYDPVNKIDGEVMNVLVEDGRIVDKIKSKKKKTIDGKGKTLMTCGVDIHTHVAGGSINSARLMRPEDKSQVWEAHGDIRSGSGFSCPSTFTTGYLYALSGYSFLTLPDLSPLKAKHTHHEIVDIPLMDKACLLMLGNNYLVANYIAENEREKLTDYVAWMLSATKSYGIKLVAPGTFLSWIWGKKKTMPNELIPKVDVKPVEIIQALEEVAEKLRLPHPIHVHLNGMGYYGNYMPALEELKVAKKRMHVTHLQFNSYGGDSWKNFCSKTDEIIKYINSNEKITFDVGQITLDYTTTLTADSPFEQYLSKLIHEKWTSSDVELEHGLGIVPVHYSSKNPVNSIQWAVGLELVLKAKDLWRVCLSTDHPNGGPFIRYPLIISWLMDKKRRDEYASKLNKSITKGASIGSLDRELSLYEIATITRSAPAKILGIPYGGIKEGAKADLVLYDLGKGIEEGFSRADHTIIGGEIVVRKGEIVKSMPGEVLSTRKKVEDPKLERELEAFFKQHYSICLSNYPVA